MRCILQELLEIDIRHASPEPLRDVEVAFVDGLTGGSAHVLVDILVLFHNRHAIFIVVAYSDRREFHGALFRLRDGGRHSEGEVSHSGVHGEKYQDATESQQEQDPTDPAERQNEEHFVFLHRMHCAWDFGLK